MNEINGNTSRLEMIREIMATINAAEELTNAL
jgi:hypothetical protein